MSVVLKRYLGAFLMLAVACVGLVNAAEQAASLTGKWDVVTQLPIGPGNPSFNLVQNGGEISGKYSGALGESPVTGSIDGNAFKLSFTAANIDCEYTGTISGDEISGTLSLKGLGDGTFKGKRAH